LQPDIPKLDAGWTWPAVQLKSEQPCVFRLSHLMIIQGRNSPPVDPNFYVWTSRENAIRGPSICISQIRELLWFGERIGPPPAIRGDRDNASSLDEQCPTMLVVDPAQPFVSLVQVGLIPRCTGFSLSLRSELNS
jgi:hypothetical protein